MVEGLRTRPLQTNKIGDFGDLRTRPIENMPPSEPLAQNLPPQMPQEPPQQRSYMESLQNLPQRTAGAFTEGLAQSANQMVAAPLLNLAGGAAQGIGYLGGKISPEFEQGAENLAQKAYEARNYYQQPVDVFGNAPQDTLANISKKTGEMFLPIPGGAAVKGTQAAGKAFPHLAKDVGQALGAGTALETLKDVPVTGIQGIDDILKSVAGMALANKAMTPRNTKMVAALDKTAQEAIQKMPIDEKILGRVFSVGAKPEKEILDSAKKDGVILPANIKLNSWWSHFLANNIFKSMFTSKAWKNVVENSDKSAVNAWEENVTKIYPKEIAQDTANLEYETALKSEATTTKEEAKKLYDEANKHLTGSEYAIPTETINVLKDITEELKAPSQSGPSGDVLRKVGEILTQWSPDTKLLKKTLSSTQFDSSALTKAIETQLMKNPKKVPLKEMTNQISRLLESTKYGENAEGVRANLTLIVKSLNKDIRKVSHLNPEFHAKREAARAFYKNEVGNRIKTDMARSMLTGQRPKEAMQFMNSPRDIKQLSHILGNFSGKEEVMSGLKRAKFQSVVADKITNKDGTINYANLSGMFEKRSDLQPLLKELSGNNYESLKRLANVAQAITKGGRQLANFSGTSHTTADLKRVGQLIDTVLSLGTGAAAVAGNLKTAGVAIATPYVLSKVMANTRYVDAGVQYALARQQNNFKKAMQYQRSMENIFEKEILAKTPLVNQNEE